MRIKFIAFLIEIYASKHSFWSTFKFMYFDIKAKKKIDYYCSNETIMSIIENLLFSAIYISLVLEGIYGFIASKGMRSFYADKLMTITKFAISTFEISIVLFVLIQNNKFSEILTAWQTQNSKANSQQLEPPGYTFFFFTLMCIIPQILLWSGFIYIAYQFLLYTRSIFLVF